MTFANKLSIFNNVLKNKQIFGKKKHTKQCLIYLKMEHLQTILLLIIFFPKLCPCFCFSFDFFNRSLFYVHNYFVLIILVFIVLHHKQILCCKMLFWFAESTYIL